MTIIVIGSCLALAAVAYGHSAPAKAKSLELLGCGVKNGALRTFSCGLLVP